MPAFTCILLFANLYMLDGLRLNIARNQCAKFAIVMGSLSSAITAVGFKAFFISSNTPKLESVATGFFFSLSLAVYFVRTKLQKDESERRHLAAQAAALLLHQQLQHQAIRQHFCGPAAPAG
ncbi:hypothetical protein PENTCL1PPCAC_9824 [Pristionchus entomophagus]|uniref:G protein-coupled receptor n=1 Tax=Pristionchus entomophagus TaxID=358040 RepID=A0AAV5SXL8_9BILA|nr:hypothetical protein PENTCL1PPCAC_9824 [Pristionchus entomophagus]